MAELTDESSCDDAKAQKSDFDPNARGFSKHPLHQIWEGMKVRCYTKTSGAYHKYGARGIEVLEPWRSSFKAFYFDMAPTWVPGLTLDRKNSTGPYCKDNCRWADLIQQGNNKRNNVLLVLRERSQTIAQWAREIGIPHKSLRARIELGWSHERALTEPHKPRIKKQPITGSDF